MFIIGKLAILKIQGRSLPNPAEEINAALSNLSADVCRAPTVISPPSESPAICAFWMFSTSMMSMISFPTSERIGGISCGSLDNPNNGISGAITRFVLDSAAICRCHIAAPDPAPCINMIGYPDPNSITCMSFHLWTSMNFP